MAGLLTDNFALKRMYVASEAGNTQQGNQRLVVPFVKGIATRWLGKSDGCSNRLSI